MTWADLEFKGLKLVIGPYDTAAVFFGIHRYFLSEVRYGQTKIPAIQYRWKF